MNMNQADIKNTLSGLLRQSQHPESLSAAIAMPLENRRHQPPHLRGALAWSRTYPKDTDLIGALENLLPYCSQEIRIDRGMVENSRPVEQACSAPGMFTWWE